MDVLLTQLYGMILLINLFAIIVAACLIYNLEFKGQAIKKLWMLPFSVPKLFVTKFILLTLDVYKRQVRADDVLSRLQQGEISAEEAIALLKK